MIRLYALLLVTFLLMSCTGQDTSGQSSNSDTATVEKTMPSSENSDASIPEDWETWANENISIAYPKDWEVDDSGAMGAPLIIFKTSGGFNDGFNDNIVYTEEPLTTNHGVGLEDYAAFSREQLETYIVDYKQISNELIKGEMYDYHQIVFEGKQGEFKLGWLQNYYVAEGVARVVTFTALQDRFQENLVEAEQIMRTFRF